LGGVVATEKSIWSFTHFFRGDTERNHGSVDDTIVLEGPEIVELLLFHVFVWGKTQNTIRIVTKSLRFIKGQELEEGALVVLEFDFLLNSV
jgi:hypothetical protein